MPFDNKMLAALRAMGGTGGSGGGGVSSWNDLTDKPFGEGKKEIQIIPEQTVSGANTDHARLTNYDSPRVGTTYAVYFDGVRYECVGFNDGGYRTVGAPDGDYSKYPFSVYYDAGVYCSCADDNEHTISVSRVDTTLIQIDPKFIPDPVVSWGSLTAKPVYKDKEIKEITWDGNTEGLTVFNTVYYKISDLTLTPEQLMWQTIHAVENGSELSFTVDAVAGEDSAFMAMAGGMPAGVMVILDGSSVGTSNGVYFMKVSDEV